MDREPDDTHETTDRGEVDLITAEARKQGHRVKVNARRVDGVVTYNLRFWAAEGTRGEIDTSAEALDVPAPEPEPAPASEESPKPKKGAQKATEPEPEPSDII